MRRVRALIPTLLLALAASGCRIRSSSPVSLPTEGRTFVVTCNYELANCRRHAEAHCPGQRIEEITLKNCPRCAGIVPAHPQSGPAVQQPGYRATFYYRCM
jgi:hypothetical protein